MDDTLVANLNTVYPVQKVSAAVVNISGRQRMLSQRIALFACKLICSQSVGEREHMRQELQSAIDLIETSHQALLQGDPDSNLPGNPSPAVRAIYFESPVYLDRLLRSYIAAGRALLTLPDPELIPTNEHFYFITDLASKELLPALDAVVRQYQQEGEAEQREMAEQQKNLYYQSCAAAAAAQIQAQKLEEAIAQLHETQSQLIHAEKMLSLGQLVAGVAHEINNPVNFIYGNLVHAQDYTHDLLELLQLYHQHHPHPASEVQAKAEAIELPFLSEDLPKLLTSMQVGAERIQKIVLSLRNFSRLDEADMKAVNIHEGIDSTLMILQHRLKPKPHHPAIQIIKDYGTLPPVECYAGQLNQVFMNILVNALDALEEWDLQRTPEAIRQTPSTIRICTQMSSPDWIMVQIADNGPGMPEPVRNRLFDPFFTTKSVGKGTGLGLSISHQIVTSKHGGSLQCISTPNEGATFVVQIPVQQG